MSTTLFERQLCELNSALAEATGAPTLAMAKSQQGASDRKVDGQISGSEFMAKALTAQARGFITGAQLAEAEQYIGMRKRPPEPIVRAVIDGRAYSPWG